MKETLRQLLTGIIDYAGLFPPASLPMSEAAAAYASYRRGPHAWLLSRFVCPAARFQEFHASAFADGGAATSGVAMRGEARPWRLSVLGRGGATSAEFYEGLGADFDLCRAFVEQCTGQAVVDAVEVRLPGGVLVDTPAHHKALITNMADRMMSHGRSTNVSPDLFLEVPLAAGTQRGVESLIASLAWFNADHNTSFKLKVRTGGVEASSVPDTPLLAHFMTACAAHRVGFKATAGLHHPLRHYAESIRGPMHGFINVFVGAVLAWRSAINTETLCDLLCDERADSFRFEDERLSWRDVSADVGAARDARREFALGFGSCSLMEPVHDLGSLGLYRA